MILQLNFVSLIYILIFILPTMAFGNAQKCSTQISDNLTKALEIGSTTPSTTTSTDLDHLLMLASRKFGSLVERAEPRIYKLDNDSSSFNYCWTLSAQESSPFTLVSYKTNLFNYPKSKWWFLGPHIIKEIK